MSGWVKVGLLTALAVIALVGLNVSLWRRMKAATREVAARRTTSPDHDA